MRGNGNSRSRPPARILRRASVSPCFLFFNGAALFRTRKFRTLATKVRNQPSLQRSRIQKNADSCASQYAMYPVPNQSLSRVVLGGNEIWRKRLTADFTGCSLLPTKQPLGIPRAEFGKRGRVVECSRLLIGQ